MLRIQGGSILMATPFKKSGKFLIKIATYLAKFNNLCHDLEQGCLDFDIHIGPSILKEI